MKDFSDKIEFVSTKRRNYDDIYNHVEENLRLGHALEALQALEKLNAPSVPLHWRLKFAQQCRRSGSISKGLKIMHPLLKQSKNGELEVASAVLAEYALLLEKEGAYEEAAAHLEKNANENSAEILFSKAAIHVGQWDYESAIPVFQKYIQIIESPYQKTIGMVNLAASLATVQRNEESLKLLQSIYELCQANDWKRLLANALEIEAQIRIFQLNFKPAEKLLVQSQEILGKGTASDKLRIEKWMSIIKSHQEKSLSPLKKFSIKASQQKNWTAVRDCDLQILKIKFNQDLFDHLYFGSPFEGYRCHIERELGIKNSKEFIVLGDHKSPCLDLLTGQISPWPKNPDLKAGKKIHQLIQILFQDFYAPLLIGKIFSKLFPDEYYNPETSPKRVRQIIYRARKWIQEEKIPLVINELSGSYRISKLENICVKTYKLEAASDENEILFSKVKSFFNDQKSFKSLHLRNKLKLSYGRGQRFLTWAIEKNLIAVHGEAKYTMYSLVEKD